MTLTNVTGGLIQDLFGVAVVIALFSGIEGPGWLMALGAIGSRLDQIVKVSVARHRPTANLVTILSPSSGYSYPSGHALFFTWLAFMLAIAISPHVHPRWRVVVWMIAVFVIVFACIGRIWAGAHWPTDVIGGFLLGVALVGVHPLAAGALAADAERSLDSHPMARIATVPRMKPRRSDDHPAPRGEPRGPSRVTAMAQRRLSAAFPGYEQIDFDPGMDLGKLLTSNATVVVAGGDGTVGFVARTLAGSTRRLGILPLGTFNNFAHGLGNSGRPRPGDRCDQGGRDPAGDARSRQRPVLPRGGC